ncbi:MAG: hypothetical protein JNL96_20530 [Planctomycetaceae bacterium]|nr:hypothetical protein [Planctomycetaceae bacterium]
MYGSWHCVVRIDDFQLVYLGVDSAEAATKHRDGETVYVVSERMGDAQRFAGIQAAQEHVARSRRRE